MTDNTEMQKVSFYRGLYVEYCPKYDSFNVRDPNGGWIVDGLCTEYEAKRGIDYYLKSRRYSSARVGGLWDSCPLEYLTESGDHLDE